jgi:hypothetical protein
MCETLLGMHLAMMGFLARDIGNNRLLGRVANRQSTVAALPAEMAMPFVSYDLSELVLRFLTNSATEVVLARPERI